MAGVQRTLTHLSPASAINLPNNTDASKHPYQHPDDQRSLSTASLLPLTDAAEAVHTGKSNARQLLCVFIHGFVGDETSFRSFPAHFHELLTVLVANTHIVHTKVYPKFKTRDKLTIAVENFSRWYGCCTSSSLFNDLCAKKRCAILAGSLNSNPPQQISFFLVTLWAVYSLPMSR